MAVTRCYLCEKDEEARHLDTGLEEGIYCPVCHRPACRHHLATVRWRWRDEWGRVDSALVCIECRRTYRHRSWDAFNRDWIS
jgi:uncharacterized protein YbaR (Trm112 family)